LGEEDIQDKRITEVINDGADLEFNQKYSYIDMAFNVAKEAGVSYFEIIEHPAIHVLSLTTYLIEKVKKIERDYKSKAKQ
jgi:hypothetical protein